MAGARRGDPTGREYDSRTTRPMAGCDPEGWPALAGTYRVVHDRCPAVHQSRGVVPSRRTPSSAWRGDARDESTFGRASTSLATAGWHPWTSRFDRCGGPPVGTAAAGSGGAPVGASRLAGAVGADLPQVQRHRRGHGQRAHAEGHGAQPYGSGWRVGRSHYGLGPLCARLPDHPRIVMVLAFGGGSWRPRHDSPRSHPQDHRRPRTFGGRSVFRRRCSVGMAPQVCDLEAADARAGPGHPCLGPHRSLLGPIDRVSARSTATRLLSQVRERGRRAAAILRSQQSRLLPSPSSGATTSVQGCAFRAGNRTG